MTSGGDEEIICAVLGGGGGTSSKSSGGGGMGNFLDDICFFCLFFAFLGVLGTISEGTDRDLQKLKEGLVNMILNVPTP